MNAKERARMERIERENAELRAKIADHMRVAGNLLCEICELRARLAGVADAIKGQDYETTEY
jgi:Zn-dependent oligopeptidase